MQLDESNDVWAHGDIKYGRWTFTASDFDPSKEWMNVVATTKSYRECPPIEVISDSFLFHADPKMLAYGNLLRLAQHHSNTEIYNKANAGRPRPVFKTVSSVKSKLSVAYKWSAEQNSPPQRETVTTAEEVEQWLHMVRFENAVRLDQAR